MHAGVEAIGGEGSHTRRGRVWARGTAFFPRATSSCGTTANVPDAILRAVADTDKDCVGSLYLVASARRGNGDRAWAVLPGFVRLRWGGRDPLVRAWKCPGRAPDVVCGDACPRRRFTRSGQEGRRTNIPCCR